MTATITAEPRILVADGRAHPVRLAVDAAIWGGSTAFQTYGAPAGLEITAQAVVSPTAAELVITTGDGTGHFGLGDGGDTVPADIEVRPESPELTFVGGPFDGQTFRVAAAHGLPYGAGGTPSTYAMILPWGHSPADRGEGAINPLFETFGAIVAGSGMASHPGRVAVYTSSVRGTWTFVDWRAPAAAARRWG